MTGVPEPNSQWLDLVEKALRGKSFEAELVSRTLDGIRIEPLYSPSAGQAIDRVHMSGWDIRSLVAEADPAAVNRIILDELSGGAGSITLQLASPGQFGLPMRFDAIGRALKDVRLDIAPVTFLAGDQYFGALQCLMALWDEQGLEGANRRARLDADPLGTLARTGALEQDLWSTLEVLAHFVKQNLDSLGNVSLLLADGRPYHDAGATEAEEIAMTLATAVEYLRALDYEGVRADRVVPRMGLALGADADVLMTIAKFRAMRLVFARMAETVGAAGPAGSVELAATTSPRMLSRRAPETNILRSTLAAAGAIIGGADAITVLPHTSANATPDADARRLARNTSIVLQQEANLGRVADPLAGSGAIESLTGELASKAWSIFQEIEAAGGMAKTLLSGMIGERIAAARAWRSAEFANGTRRLIGVSDGPIIAQGALPQPEPISGDGARITRLEPVFDEELAKA